MRYSPRLSAAALCLALTACASAPPPPTAPAPTTVLLIGDCSDLQFVAVIDATGHVAFMGGDAKPTDADRALIARAQMTKDLKTYRIRLGDCQDD